TADPVALAAATHLVLPRGGAVAHSPPGLHAVPGGVGARRQHHAPGKPFLGICVGMQLMATRGLEHGETAGFDWIAGDVAALTPAPLTDGRARKIPHRGWNQLGDLAGDHPDFADLGAAPYVYFVHGFHLCADDPGAVLATTDYGQKVTAAVGRDNLVGVQFHPEKSQTAGLRLIANFLRWRP
ncbi:MAG: imidazole glycerol phosphate synthase subunit HisH, partial [Pseudomonadota bacterium]|nr:imidazole glycerol phosphate synthase subunit HisH [Pseudomonadota bacterium]